MNHLNINARVVASWLKKKGWQRGKDDLGRPVFIDPLSTAKCHPEIAVETQMCRENKVKPNPQPPVEDGGGE